MDFPFSMWNYNSLENFGHVGDADMDELSVWKQCGLNIPCLPRFSVKNIDPSEIIPILDRAESLGLKLIANINELMYPSVNDYGEEGYRALCREVYSKIRHPALFGLFIGDEPNGAKAFSNCMTAMRIQREEMPELSPWVNFHTDMDSVDPSEFGGLSFREWLKKAAAESGFRIFSYGHYGQVAGEEGIDSYFRNLKALSEAAEEAGVELWNTQLSSAHHVFRIPNEYDFTWQITTAAACGSRGIVWFRFYDRLAGPNYHGSPVDEYGNLTEQYYRLLRSQRKFNDHWGRLIMSLHHEKTFINPSLGGYPEFGPGCHPVIDRIEANSPAVISFFSDDKYEYLVLVNASQKTDGVYKIFFDDSYILEELLFNGEESNPYDYGNTELSWDGLWLYPGQMAIYRIRAKN